MAIVIVDNQSRHMKALVRLCAEHDRVRVVGPHELDTIMEGELIVLSGSHVHGVRRSGYYYEDELNLIRSFRGALIGVCAGMQIIASAYGGRLMQLSFEVEGPRTIVIDDPDLRFGIGGEPRVKVAERHGWAVTNISRPLVDLARSDNGIEVLRHVSRPIIGMQFHPELKPTDGRKIFNWAIQELSEERSRQLEQTV